MHSLYLVLVLLSPLSFSPRRRRRRHALDVEGEDEEDELAGQEGLHDDDDDDDDDELSEDEDDRFDERPRGGGAAHRITFYASNVNIEALVSARVCASFMWTEKADLLEGATGAVITRHWHQIVQYSSVSHHTL